jgi:hypothetical protein
MIVTSSPGAYRSFEGLRSNVAAPSGELTTVSVSVHQAAMAGRCGMASRSAVNESTAASSNVKQTFTGWLLECLSIGLLSHCRQLPATDWASFALLTHQAGDIVDITTLFTGNGPTAPYGSEPPWVGQSGSQNMATWDFIFPSYTRTMR